MTQQGYLSQLENHDRHEQRLNLEDNADPIPGLERAVADSPDDASHNVSALKSQLRERHRAAEAAAHLANLPEQVSENIGRLAELVGLNDADRCLLAFAVMLQNEPQLAEAAEYLGSLTSMKVYLILSEVLALPLPEIRASLGSDGVLTSSGLLAFDRSGAQTLRYKLNMLSDRFADHVSSTSADPIGLLRGAVLPSKPGELTLNDFMTPLHVYRRSIAASDHCATELLGAI